MIATLDWTDWERLARIGHVASKDQARPILTGIQLETDDGRLRATATDAYKLATVAVDADVGEGGPILVPARQVRIATSAFRQLAGARLGSKWTQNLEGIELSLVESPKPRPHLNIELIADDRYLGSLVLDLIEGNFPNHRDLLVKPDHKRLARSTLRRRGKDAILTYLRVQFGKYVDLEGRTVDSLLDEIDELHAEPIERTVGLNPDYMNELMRTTKIDHQPLKIEMFGSVRPIFFSNPSDEDWQGIQMPVRTR